MAGQLGLGDTEQRDTPTQVLGVGDDLEEVVVAGGRTCIRRGTGVLLCWGSNGTGELGDGTREDALLPTQVVVLSDARQLALDDYSTCALRANGSVACWGEVARDNTDPTAFRARTIENLDGVIDLVGSVSGTYCARGAAGWTRCWWLDDGTWTAAQDAKSLAGATAIAVSDLDVACGVVAEGRVVCEVLETGEQYPLFLSSRQSQMAGGQLIACSGDEDNQWLCWNVLRPALEEANGSWPLPLPLGSVRPVELSVGGLRACALLPDDSVVCADANEVPLALRAVEGLPD